MAIKIRNVETNQTRAVPTNHEGSYTITNLPAGHYELTAEMAGFRSYQQSEIVLEIEQTLRNDVQLTLGNIIAQPRRPPQQLHHRRQRSGRLGQLRR